MYFGALGISEFPPLVQAEIRRCEAAGGYPIVRYNAYDANRAPLASSAYVAGCDMPKAAAPGASSAPINISVPTQISTQVSPQISPVLVQQDQPQNSPVTATPVSAPTQTAPILHWNEPEPATPAPVSSQPFAPYESAVAPPAVGEPQPAPIPQPGVAPGIIMAGAALLLGAVLLLKPSKGK